MKTKTVRFKVWTRSPRYFPSVDQARIFAARYEAKTGNVVAITVVG